MGERALHFEEAWGVEKLVEEMEFRWKDICLILI